MAKMMLTAADRAKSYALRNACAYVAVTGICPTGMSGETSYVLHRDLLANWDWWIAYSGQPGQLHLNDEGHRLAASSRLFKAAQHLLALGFKVRKVDLGQRKRSARTINFTAPAGNPWSRGDWSFNAATDKGNAYVDGKVVASFKNTPVGGGDEEPSDTDQGMVEDCGQESERANDAWASSRYQD